MMTLLQATTCRVELPSPDDDDDDDVMMLPSAPILKGAVTGQDMGVDPLIHHRHCIHM
jgi:hypothetical protein